jgi:hypothetical protein
MNYSHKEVDYFLFFLFALQMIVMLLIIIFFEFNASSRAELAKNRLTGMELGRGRNCYS